MLDRETLEVSDPMTLSFTDAERLNAETLITLALQEDLGDRGDVTSMVLLEPTARGTVRIGTRKAGVLAGLPIVQQVFNRLDPQVQVTLLVADGAPVTPGTVVAELHGPVRSLLAGERTALNFLTHLSGIASLTAQFVAATNGTRAGIYDTRKTIPGWRLLAKYAVRAGGGRNHRMGLFDAILIKDNHLGAWLAATPGRTIAAAVRQVRSQVPAGMIVQVEVDTLVQFDDAIEGAPDIILLDNLSPEQMQQAVARRDVIAPAVELEASGGINLQTIRAIAECGVERISIGALTHSAPQLDLGFDWL